MATAMSLISTNFPEDKEKYISYIGASMGFGLMVGPPLGSFIFGNLNFAMVFYFFSIWIFIMMVLQYVFIPSSYNKDRQSTVLNHMGKKKDAVEKLEVPRSRSASFATATASLMSQKEAMKSIRNVDQMRAISVAAQTKTKDDILKGYNNIELDDVTILSTMKIKAVVFAFLANAIAMYNVSFFSSFLAIRLKDQYGVADKNMGYYFAILSFAYLSSAILCPMIFANCPRKL